MKKFTVKGTEVLEGIDEDDPRYQVFLKSKPGVNDEDIVILWDPPIHPQGYAFLIPVNNLPRFVLTDGGCIRPRGMDTIEIFTTKILLILSLTQGNIRFAPPEETSDKHPNFLLTYDKEGIRVTAENWPP
ncbi:MAG TPA: hypothetical protein ENF20_09150 [Candidatus Marinimicrobia bacterium]|nr:hypothetical protein [Candidatus Neomarinimicrobiota bacterium]